MTREEIIGIAMDVGLMDKAVLDLYDKAIRIDSNADYSLGELDPLIFAGLDEVVSFAYKLIDAVDAKWLRGEAKVRIPTKAMEAEFSNYHRLGYKAGVAAERERCAKVCEDIERKKWETMRDGGKLEGISPRDCAAAIRRMK